MGKGCAAPSRCNSTFAALGIARVNTTLPSGCACGLFGGAGAKGTGPSDRAGVAAGCAPAKLHIPRQSAIANVIQEKVICEAGRTDRDIRRSSGALELMRSIVYIPAQLSP